MFKQRVEIECRRLGITKSDLARAIGTTYQSLDRILRNGSPRVVTAQKIANALGLPLEILFLDVSEDEYAEVAAAAAVEKFKNL